MAKRGELEPAQQGLHTIIGHTPAIVASRNSGLYNRFANSTYEEWFRIRPAEMRGRHIQHTISEERHHAVAPYSAKVLSDHQQIFKTSSH